jgi:hypothetical protein
MEVWLVKLAPHRGSGIESLHVRIRINVNLRTIIILFEFWRFSS